MLEEMAQKGCIFRTRDGEKPLYQAYQFVIGLYEFQLNRIDREFSELFEEYRATVKRPGPIERTDVAVDRVLYDPLDAVGLEAGLSLELPVGADIAGDPIGGASVVG